MSTLLKFHKKFMKNPFKLKFFLNKHQFLYLILCLTLLTIDNRGDSTVPKCQ